MALSGLNTNWLKGSFELDRNYLLKVAENNGLRLGTDLSGLKPHYDGKDSIALGYGLDLLTNDLDKVKIYLSAVGITLTTAALSTIGSAKTTRNTLQGLVSQLAAETDPIKRAALNTQIAGKKTELRNHASSLAVDVQLRDEAHASDLLNVVATAKTKELDFFLKSDAPTDSHEKAVLLPMWFNTPAYIRKAGNKDTHLTASLRADNRPEAWYEIRYGSNGDELPGLAKSRYVEADFFGLYKAGTTSSNISDVEAKDVLRMYTKYHDAILKYERTWGITPWWSTDGEIEAPDNYVEIASKPDEYGAVIAKSLEENLRWARDKLIFDFVIDKGYANYASFINGEVLIGQDNNALAPKAAGDQDRQ